MKKIMFLVVLAFTLTFAVGATSVKADEKNENTKSAEAAKLLDTTGTDRAVTIEEELINPESDILIDGMLAMTEYETADGIIAEAEDEDTEKSDKKEEKAAEKTKAVKETKNAQYSNADLKLLACLIYTEAGNQSYKGKLAVANVALNRVKSSRFPNTLSGVVYQKAYSSSYGRTVYQFSVASPSVGTLKKALNVYGRRTNKAEAAMEQECIKAAKAALEGKTAFSQDYLFFTRYSKSLANRKPNGVKLEAHYFYK